MSKLEELIKELCPNGVEYFNLYTLFDNFSGMTAVTNKWAENGNCQFIDYMNAYKHIEIDINDLPYATVKDTTKQNNLMQGDVLFTSASETPNECALSSVIMGQIKSGVLLDDHLFGLRLKEQYRHIVEIGYLKYVFRANSFRKSINKTVRGVT